MGSSKKTKPYKEPKYLRAIQECAAALTTVQAALKRADNMLDAGEEKCTLNAWLKFFDCKQDGSVTLDEFTRGMNKVGYGGDCEALFERIDIDKSGTITLDEIDTEESKLWIKFRLWCVEEFDDPADMVSQLGDGRRAFNSEQFERGVKGCGWADGREQMLFRCINTDDGSEVSVQHIKWFTADTKRQRRKEVARQSAMKEHLHHVRERLQIAAAVKSFAAHMKKRYNTVLRAWRCVLDQDGSMGIQRHELFKAVTEMHWPGDKRLLWKGLDKDGSGTTSLQELDLRSAERLAKFKEFIAQKFGSTVMAFKAFDVQRQGKMKEGDFIEACKKHGFNKMTKGLFNGLDWDAKKFVLDKDLAFLDAWRCPSYLTCDANKEAAESFKEALLRMYKTFAKAWRLCLDRDNSNCVSWEEFEAAAKRVHFNGDIPGAWRALDDDLSGFISLQEIDSEAAETFAEFKRWADMEFGGVRSAFHAIDTDHSGEVSTREFRKAISTYGYQGETATLFRALDNERQGFLSLIDVVFLDEWDVSADHLGVLPTDLMVGGGGKRAGERRKAEQVSVLTPRLAQLAIPKLRGTDGGTAGMNSTGAMNSTAGMGEFPWVDTTGGPIGESPWVLKKRRPGTSPYGRLPKVSPRQNALANSNSGEDPWSPNSTNNSASPSARMRLEAMKTEILRPMKFLSSDDMGESCDESTFQMDAIRCQTKALRDRTIQLLKKSEGLDRGALRVNLGMLPEVS